MQSYKFKFPSPLVTRFIPPLVPYNKVVEEANDTTYTWLETVPENIGTEKRPLVVKLHGGGTNGEFAHDSTSWARLAVQEGFIAVFPSGRSNHGWAVEPDTYEDEIAYLNYIIDRVVEKYPVDETRIYMTGMSMGDMMSLVYSCKSGMRIAALASFCGPTYRELAESRKPECILPVMQIRGETDLGGYGLKATADFNESFNQKQDQIISNRDLWLNINGITGNPEFTINGIQNYSIYRGEEADVYYLDVKGMGHREAAWAPYIVWRSFFTKYRRIDGKIVRTEEIVPIEGDKNAAAFAAGCGYALIGGKRKALEEMVKVGTESPLPGEPASNIPKIIYAEAKDSADAYYIPVSAFGLIPGITVETAENNSFGTVSVYGKNYTFFKNSMLIETEENVHLGVEKSVLELEGKLWIPVAEMCSAIGKEVSICEDVVYIADTKNNITKGMARRIKNVLEK